MCSILVFLGSPEISVRRVWNFQTLFFITWTFSLWKSIQLLHDLYATFSFKDSTLRISLVYPCLPALHLVLKIGIQGLPPVTFLCQPSQDVDAPAAFFLREEILAFDARAYFNPVFSTAHVLVCYQYRSSEASTNLHVERWWLLFIMLWWVFSPTPMTKCWPDNTLSNVILLGRK